MKYIGSHISISGGITKAIKKAFKLNATAIGFFLKNPLQWNVPVMSEKNIQDFKNCCQKYKYLPNHILPHSGFLINLGHPNIELLYKSRDSLIQEVIRCDQLGLKFINFHPGSYLNKISKKNCLIRISESINYILNKTKNVILVLENTSGQGTNLGYRFKHLSYIIKKVKDKNRIGVCIDTCHLFSSGYDIRDFYSYSKVFNEFEKEIGFHYLKGVHLNDSKHILNSRKDRHENLGLGYIGRNFFKLIMEDKRFQDIPMILETVNHNLWKEEISWLKSKVL
ncbi:deoxyribonuclease IV [Buchnera aphidicola]|uniref:deoxyribonuclease IV n=1 Tax=Buchnera aphidicola TaxID=9 RepID=UPI00209307D5|nr:deoxyribonuclease IV [Buchnera aphidicola]USS94226.1 deoxyribonuclease IV [Buchnera aphidicola (Sipha maydis)]WII23774.1 deoxyribonuclease IV [Buchnera aphidicola (Sipha maydis)]